MKNEDSLRKHNFFLVVITTFSLLTYIKFCYFRNTPNQGINAFLEAKKVMKIEWIVNSTAVLLVEIEKNTLSLLID